MEGCPRPSSQSVLEEVNKLADSRTVQGEHGKTWLLEVWLNALHQLGIPDWAQDMKSH